MKFRNIVILAIVAAALVAAAKFTSGNRRARTPDIAGTPVLPGLDLAGVAAVRNTVERHVGFRFVRYLDACRFELTVYLLELFYRKLVFCRRVVYLTGAYLSALSARFDEILYESFKCAVIHYSFPFLDA